MYNHSLFLVGGLGLCLWIISEGLTKCTFSNEMCFVFVFLNKAFITACPAQALQHSQSNLDQVG